MNTILLLAGIFLILLILTGIRLRKKGDPYPSLAVTLHKVFSIGFMIPVSMLLYMLFRDADIANLEIVLFFLAGLFMLFAIVSGILLTIKSTIPLKSPFFHRLISFTGLLLLCIIALIGLFPLLV